MHLGSVTANYEHPLKVSCKMYHYSKKYNIFGTKWFHFHLQARTRWDSLWSANVIVRPTEKVSSEMG